MSVIHRYLAASALIFFLFTTVCSAQQQKEQKPLTQDEMIAKQVENLIDRYDLDDFQAFQIDTLLQHFVPIYNEEIKKVKASGASQIDSYQRVMDIWGDFFDTQYQKIFTPEQWKQYMKSTAGREKKKRDKRLAKGKADAE
jgi:hypothetical protein